MDDFLEQFLQTLTLIGLGFGLFILLGLVIQLIF